MDHYLCTFRFYGLLLLAFQFWIFFLWLFFWIFHLMMPLIFWSSIPLRVLSTCLSPLRSFELGQYPIQVLHKASMLVEESKKLHMVKNKILIAIIICIFSQVKDKTISYDFLTLRQYHKIHIWFLQCVFTSYSMAFLHSLAPTCL